MAASPVDPRCNVSRSACRLVPVASTAVVGTAAATASTMATTTGDVEVSMVDGWGASATTTGDVEVRWVGDGMVAG